MTKLLNKNYSDQDELLELLIKNLTCQNQRWK
jgi:hypothetical protein